MTSISPIIYVRGDPAGRSSAADAHASPRWRALAWRIILPILIAAMTLIHIYRSPHDVAGVEISPDEVEYAVAAQRLATLGHYDVSIDNRSLPPRYPPGFSLMLAPIYKLWPRQIGAGIGLVQFFAVVAALAAFLLARRIAAIDDIPNELAGVIAAAAVVTLGSFDIAARFIMTDVPTVALWLVLAWLFASRDLKTWTSMAAIGMLIAIAVAIRTTNLWLVVPFVLRDGLRKPIRNFVAVVAPVALILLTQAIYQQTVFGSPMRSGYHVWCPIPYDFPSQVFSADFISANLAMLWVYAPILLIGILGTFILIRRKHDLRWPLTFVFGAVLPLSLMHVLYFTPASRFYLPLLCMAAVLAGAGIAIVLPLQRSAGTIASLAIMVVVACLPSPRPIDSPGVAEHVRRNIRSTPENAIILTAQDLVWMEPATRNSHRRLIPFTRAQEYASKRLAYLPLQAPSDWNNPFKAVPVVAYAVEDDPARVAVWLARGYPVYLDLSALDYGSPLVRQLLEQCSFHSVSGRLDLWQLGARP